MREFTFVLNCHVEAQNEEAALELAQEIKKFLEERGPIKFRSEIEIDDVEEL